MRIAVILAPGSRGADLPVVGALQRQRHEVLTLEADADLPVRLRAAQAQVAFLTTGGGENGALQGMLEFLDLPYTGSGMLASALSVHRGMAKGILRLAGVPTAPWVTWTAADSHDPMQLLSSRGMGLPLFAAPAEGSGQAEVVASEARLREVCRQAPPGGLLLEMDRPGTALSVVVLDEPLRALPPSGFPTLSGPLLEQVERAAIGAHRALQCRSISLVEMTLHRRSLEDPWEVLVRQVHPMPPLTEGGAVATACAVGGLSFDELVASLVGQALARRSRTAVGGSRG